MQRSEVDAPETVTLGGRTLACSARHSEHAFYGHESNVRVGYFPAHRGMRWVVFFEVLRCDAAVRASVVYSASSDDVEAALVALREQIAPQDEVAFDLAFKEASDAE